MQQGARRSEEGSSTGGGGIGADERPRGSTRLTANMSSAGFGLGFGFAFFSCVIGVPGLFAPAAFPRAPPLIGESNPPTSPALPMSPMLADDARSALGSGIGENGDGGIGAALLRSRSCSTRSASMLERRKASSRSSSCCLATSRRGDESSPPHSSHSPSSLPGSCRVRSMSTLTSFAAVDRATLCTNVACEVTGRRGLG